MDCPHSSRHRIRCQRQLLRKRKNKVNTKLFERVKVLYEQAAAQCSEGSAWEWEMKFAELIVEECAKVAWRNTPDYEELDYSHLISNKIKEHFGISE